MLVTDDGMFIEVREVQPEKAEIPILVTDDGMFIEVREEQSEKAELPMLVTDDGMFIEVREEQPEKAEPPMLVTLHPPTRSRIFTVVTVALFSTSFTDAVELASSME